MPETVGKPNPASDAMSLESALTRCRHRGHPISTIIDVGASNGIWSARAKQFYPHAHCHLIEAQPVHEADLRALALEFPDFSYTLAAASDQVGEVYFDVGDALAGAASHDPLPPGVRSMRLPATTVDHEVAHRRLRPPFLLKLDTHGFEVPILQGAVETLRQTELICMETYNFKIAAPCIRFHEMIAYMETKGFRCIDACDPLWRKGDAALWQWDLFFAPATRPEFSRTSYHPK